MDPLRIPAEEQGFFTRAQAREAGYSDRGVRRMIQGGVWRRIRRGYYTFSDLWLSLSAEQRHLVRARAVLHHLGPAVALSHVSGCLAHGIDVWDVDLSRVHVTRLDGGAGRVEGDVVHHEGYCADADVAEVDGILVLCPERCALETAATVDKERGLVVVDSLLYHGHCSKKALTARFRLMARWPGIQHLQVVVPLADGRSQSPGESRGRYLFWSHHLPAPTLQYEVRDEDGILVGTCDWGWPDREALGEFDGRIKYSRLLRPGQTPADAVFAEKRREDRLTEVTGFRMIRLAWTDLSDPGGTAARVRRVLGLSGPARQWRWGDRGDPA